MNRIYSFGYSDPNVGGGVKFTPPARFWTFFSLPGIGLNKTQAKTKHGSLDFGEQIF